MMSSCVVGRVYVGVRSQRDVIGSRTNIQSVPLAELFVLLLTEAIK